MKFRPGDLIEYTYNGDGVTPIQYRVLKYDPPTDDITVEVTIWPREGLVIREPGKIMVFKYSGDIDRFTLNEASRVQHILSNYEV